MMTQEATKKYEVVEDLPGVGRATADKLKELGFNTVESVATATGPIMASCARSMT